MPVSVSLLLGFVLMSAVLSAIPGPSVIIATSRAVTHGKRAAMWTVLGSALGGVILLGLVIAGLGAIVAASSQLFLIVKVLGAAYLLWLGVQALMSARYPQQVPLEPRGGVTRGSRLGWMQQGFLVGVTNPKSLVSLMAVLPQFVDPGLGSPVLQMVIIGLVGAGVQMLIESTWVVAAGAMRNWLSVRPRRLQALKASGGIAMIGMSGKLAFEK